MKRVPLARFSCLLVLILGCAVFPPRTGADVLQFEDPVYYPVCENPICVAIGELDGVSNADLVFANQEWVQYTVHVLLNKGDGTYGEPDGYIVDWGVSSVDVGDMNGDSNQDIVAVVSIPGASVNVLLGDGAGAFQLAGSGQVGFLPSDVTIGDINADGIPDVATANYDSSNVSVLFGIGDGWLHPQATYDLSGYWPEPTSVAIGDLNGDGAPELAVTNAEGDVQIFINVGNGTFLSPVSYPTGAYSSDALLEDLDVDGHLDLAVANYLDATISLFLGNGDGTLKPAVTCTVGSHPRTIATGDLDSDGRIDLAVSSSFGVSVLLGSDPPGTYQDFFTFPVGGGTGSIVMGDLDNDGRQDLAATQGQGVVVMINASTTIGAAITCSPVFGVVPFETLMSVELVNSLAGSSRTIAGRINATLAGGAFFGNWRAGSANVAAGSSYLLSWSQNIPAMGSVIGANLFGLEAEDVTPAPYNQPPYPPAGDTVTASCTVTGFAP